MPEEILIEAEGIGKKFCRSLKRSLWYGTQDILGDLNPFSAKNLERPNLREDEFWALRDVSFQLRRGECLGLIGHNGAGKSTLLKILNGLIRPDTGRLMVRGKVGALIELSAGFNPILSGRENIYNRGALLGFSRDEIEEKFDAIVDFAETGEFIDMPVQNYSSGMQVRLGFAVSSQMEPDVLILDEVLAVGDLAFRFKCLNAMSELLKNSAVIFVSHSMPQIFRICTEAMVLNQGKSILHSKDVAEGIGAYFSLVEHSDIQVTGSGEATLLECQLKSEGRIVERDETIDMTKGKPLSVHLKIKLEKTVSAARVQVIFWNQEMIPVLDVMDQNDCGFLVEQNGDEIIEVEVDIPNLYLNSGQYSLTVCINSAMMDHLYCRHDNAGTVTISNRTSSGAHFVIPGVWHHRSG